jgi:hypothetical protein
MRQARVGFVTNYWEKGLWDLLSLEDGTGCNCLVLEYSMPLITNAISI